MRVFVRQALANYGSVDVAGLAALAGRVATHYKGRGTILALDLKNEPHFGDLASAVYPTGATPTLQDPGTVTALGETVPRDTIPDFRNSDEGRQRIPARLNDDQAYIYMNVLNAYLQFNRDAQAWGNGHHATVVNYMQSGDSASWAALKDALNNTFAAWDVSAPDRAGMR